MFSESYDQQNTNAEPSVGLASNPDLWVQNESQADSTIAGGFALRLSKQGKYRSAESVFLLVLKNNIFWLMRIRRLGESLHTIALSAADFLRNINPLDRPEPLLVTQLGDHLGCHSELIRYTPEALIQECLDEWRLRRQVEISQAPLGSTLNEIRLAISGETAQLADLLTVAIAEMKAKYSSCSSNLEDKLRPISWVDIHNFMAAANNEVSRNRRQALLLFPALVSRAITLGFPSNFELDLRSTIDRGRPLIEFFVDRWRVSPYAVRALRGLGFDMIGATWRGCENVLLRLLSSIAPEHLPRTAVQWAVFTEQAQTFSTASKTPMGSETVGQLMASASRRQWRSTAQATHQALEQIRMTDNFLADLFRALRAWHLASENQEIARPHDSTFHKIASQNLFALPIKKRNALVQMWHRECNRSNEITDVSEIAFPVLLEKVIMFAGMQIVQLRSPSDLRQEAASMGHCVDTYVMACERGKSAIFSLRNEKGIRQSTFELSIRPFGLSEFEIDVVQHSGKNNTPPCSTAINSLKTFLHTLRGPQGIALLQRFNRERILRRAGLQLVRDHQMAVALRAFLEHQSEDQLGFDMLLEQVRSKRI